MAAMMFIYSALVEIDESRLHYVAWRLWHPGWPGTICTQHYHRQVGSMSWPNPGHGATMPRNERHTAGKTAQLSILER